MITDYLMLVLIIFCFRYDYKVKCNIGNIELLEYSMNILLPAFFTPIRLRSGIEYFATVEACNGVLLCSKVVSHPLLADDTVPNPGIVSVGFSGDHEHYISSL